MSGKITRTYTFNDGNDIVGSQLETEIDNIINTHNSLDSGTSKWTVVNTSNASSTPLISDNSSGTNNIAEFKDNGTAVWTIADGGNLVSASKKITGLAAGSATGDAATYEQLKVVQTVSATSTSAFTTTSNTAQTTNTSVSITPTSSSNKVLVLVAGVGRTANAANSSIYISLYRGTTNLGGGTDAALVRIVGPSGVVTGNGSFAYLDSPATTSATTYSVKIWNDDNATSVSFPSATKTSIVAMEVV
jgi:hypothetical protein